MSAAEIREPSTADWRGESLFIRVLPTEDFKVGRGAEVSLTLSPMEAQELAAMLSNALRWLDQRITQEDRA